MQLQTANDRLLHFVIDCLENEVKVKNEKWTDSGVQVLLSQRLAATAYMDE